ncbi:MAG: GNAT family N-acetyltransferase [Planctomycetota bacterium]|jgi:ribosomal protein S18 acetylase RimI-like enzyme
MVIRPARRKDDLVAVARLFREYQAAIGVDLCFQDFEDELATLPGRYAEPQGGLWLAGRRSGVVALRPLATDGECEMKRLYVPDKARGRGLGRKLAELCVAEARARGYRTLRLDTLASMDAANHIYRSLGFVETDAYYENPLPGVRYYALELTSA